MAENTTPKAKEPVAISAAIVALVAAIGPVLIAFDIPVTDAQIGAVSGLVTTLVAVAAGLYARSKVTPVDKVTPPVTSERDL